MKSFFTLPRGWLLGVCVWLVAAGQALAGGSGLNVVVVVNQKSSNSVVLGNYYCERRQILPENLLNRGASRSNFLSVTSPGESIGNGGFCGGWTWAGVNRPSLKQTGATPAKTST